MEKNSFCINCLKPWTEHRSDDDTLDFHCPTEDGRGYYMYVFYVPCDNLEYLERKQKYQEEKEQYEALCRRS
jgi:hypothetical protein